MVLPPPAFAGQLAYYGVAAAWQLLVSLHIMALLPSAFFKNERITDDLHWDL